jgi:WD40 repeat protein
MNIAHIEAPCDVVWKVCAHKGETSSACFNRDGDIVYTGGSDGVVKGWRSKDGKELGTMGSPGKAVTDLSVSLDNEYVLASLIDQNKLVLYRTKTNTKMM